MYSNSLCTQNLHFLCHDSSTRKVLHHMREQQQKTPDTDLTFKTPTQSRIEQLLFKMLSESFSSCCTYSEGDQVLPHYTQLCQSATWKASLTSIGFCHPRIGFYDERSPKAEVYRHAQRHARPFRLDLKVEVSDGVIVSALTRKKRPRGSEGINRTRPEKQRT